MSTNNIQEISLEAVMGERFGRYSKYIIQERALPDIRDGLKPVQRRILYAMNEDSNTYDKAFRKSAKAVGNVMGNFHPHGDSSIYDALVRLSQNWKLREPLIEMNGNNGSMDGDPAAAMRYTEARLSKIAGEMLRDINKDTVEMVLNFDDTTYEPTVLPARFPNLLVNGATGISAGYATEIPPHNLKETIQATIYLMDHPQATVEDLMQFIQGPDFPTGGILQGIKGIKKAYQTGRGKVVLRSKTVIEPLKAGKHQIVVTEIPYEVNKAVLVKKIDEVRLLKKVEGIAEVRDESDRQGLRIVIELKRNTDSQGILNYLFKNTDLQVAYNFNMVAINNKRPEHVGLKQILNAYIDHQRSVTRKRTQYDLQKARKRKHIVDGLIKALSILDDVIMTIRHSENKTKAKQNLRINYGFTEKQADAIVSLQLYRLTNTDVTALEKEATELTDQINDFNAILEDSLKLDKVIKKELRHVSLEYGSQRLTQIEDQITELKIATKVTVAEEQVMVLISRQGYVKRSSVRSFMASGENDNGLKVEDQVVLQEKVSTLSHVLMFTNKGNLIYRPVHELTEARWKETGEHLSQTVGLDADEYLIKAQIVSSLEENDHFVIATKEGMIKQILLGALKPGRTYRSRTNRYIKLKTPTDQVIKVAFLTQGQTAQIVMITHGGYGLRYDLSEVPILGAKAAGVKSMDLRDDEIRGVELTDNDSVIGIITDWGAFKKLKVTEIPQTARARRGVQVLRELKQHLHHIAGIVLIDENKVINIMTTHNEIVPVIPSDYPFSDRYSNGTFVLDPQTQGEVEWIK